MAGTTEPSLTDATATFWRKGGRLLFVLPQKRMRKSGRRPARIGRTISVAGLHRVGDALHLVAKALKSMHVLSSDGPVAIAQGTAVTRR
jgi:hypothetical protein